MAEEKAPGNLINVAALGVTVILAASSLTWFVMNLSVENLAARLDGVEKQFRERLVALEGRLDRVRQDVNDRTSSRDTQEMWESAMKTLTEAVRGLEGTMRRAGGE